VDTSSHALSIIGQINSIAEWEMLALDLKKRFGVIYHLDLCGINPEIRRVGNEEINSAIKPFFYSWFSLCF